MNMQTNSLKFSSSPNVASSVHDNGIVLLHIRNGFFFASNATGARIWRGVEERQSLEAIVKDITDEYQIDQTTARVHVESFLIELERQKLIQREMPS